MPYESTLLGKRRLNETTDTKQPPAKRRRLNEPLNDKFLIKLKGALTYVLRTCVLGADNKIEDVNRTNQWVGFFNYRYSHTGEYRKIADYPMTQIDKKVNECFNFIEERKPTNQQWYYHTDYFSLKNDPIFYVTTTCPNHPLKTLSNSICNFFVSSMLTMEKRQGNCGSRSELLAKYLWEHHEGVHRIEVVDMATFDHAFVIVNRREGSNIHDSSTWGDNCWIVDAWYEQDGLIFLAKDFKEKIKEIKQFALMQVEALKRLGIKCRSVDQNTEETIRRAKLEIFPARDPYPANAQSQSVEFYYRLDNSFTADLLDQNHYSIPVDKAFTEHKKKFSGCLREIEKTSVHRFFQARKSHEKNLQLVCKM